MRGHGWASQPWHPRLCTIPYPFLATTGKEALNMSAAPKARGLYDPQWEHDACGIGAVVNISGRRDHAVVEHGKQVLLNLMHRGAAGADESTGDGAGILLQVPHEFFAAEADRLGFPFQLSAGMGWPCCSSRRTRRCGGSAKRC